MKASAPRWFKRFGVCIAFTSVLTAPVCAASTMEDWPNSFGTVMIGDLQGLMDHAGALAEKVSPGMSADMLKMQADMMLGDPKLETIPPGSGLLAVIPDSGPVYGFIELNPKKAQRCLDLLTSRGLCSAKAGEGLYALAISPDAAKEVAKEHGKDATKALEGKGEPTIAAKLQVHKLLEHFKEPIEARMKSLPEDLANMKGKMNNANAKSGAEFPDAGLKMLPTLLRFYYAAAKRVDTVALTISPSKDGVEISKSIKPVGGMSPAKKGSRTGGELLKMLPGGGAMDMEATFDPKAWAATFDEICKDVDKGSDDKSHLSSLSAWWKDYMDIADGAMAGRMMISDKKFTAVYAISVTDEAKARAMFADYPEKMKAVGLSELYDSMGMKCDLSYKAGVREHAGVKIDEMNMKIDAQTSAGAEMARAVSVNGNQVYNIAIVNKVLLGASLPTKIEDLIDAVKAGKNPDAKPLMSETKLPSGGCFYMDYNIGKVMQLSAFAFPPDSKERVQMESMFASLGEFPLLIAGYHKTDTLDFTMLLPAEMIKSVAANVGRMASPGALQSNDDETTAVGGKP